MLYRIKVLDCEGNTTIRKELTKEQAQFLGGVAAEITENGGGCCDPVMSVELIVEGDYDHPNTVKQEDLPYSQTKAARTAIENEGFNF